MDAEPTGRGDVGKIVPNGPGLPPRDRVDRGVSGSLVQARARERSQRVAERTPPSRDGRLYLAAVMIVGATAGTITGGHLLAELSGMGAVLVASSAAFVFAAALFVIARFEPGEVERSLAGAIRRERRIAPRLDALRGLGWVALHDRLLPGTEHRVAHILVGPAGIVIVSPAPSDAPVRMSGQTAFAGATSLDEWFATRWWEAETVNTAMAEHLHLWSWTGPVFPLVAVDEQKKQGLAHLHLGRNAAPVPPAHPLVYARVAVRDVTQLYQWATALPAPLGRVTSAQLADTLDRICLPAATRE